MQRHLRPFGRLLLVLVVVAAGAGSLAAQTEQADAGRPADSTSTTADSDTGATFFEIVFSGGWIGGLIVLLLATLSMAALALGLEHLMTIRRSVLMPPGMADQVRQKLSQGNLAAAQQLCQAQPSLLAFVLRAGLNEVDSGWPAVEKALEDATAEQAARLFRKIEYLSVIGNIAPMIGLLGTVIGMIFAFQEVADTQGAARAAQLAAGIYQALVTTVGGLIVAIPSLAAFAVFRNRADQLVAESVYAAGHAMLPVKRALSGRGRAEVRPVPTAPPRAPAATPTRKS